MKKNYIAPTYRMIAVEEDFLNDSDEGEYVKADPYTGQEEEFGHRF